MKTKSKLKNRNNIIFPTILVSSAFLVLFSFKNKLFPQKNNKTDSPNLNNQTLNQNDEDIDTTSFKKLSIVTNRCRGCGKCTRLDPEHFEMINAKASVISTKNLGSDALKLAINNCPAQAIIIE